MPLDLDPANRPKSDETTLDRSPALADRLLGLLLLISAVLLVAGWFLPVMTVRTLLVFYNEVSIIEGAFSMLENGDYLLVAIVVIFTIIFPVGKLALAYLVWQRLDRPDHNLSKALHWVELFSKWSMLDVFVVALVVVIAKISLVSDVAIHLGLYIFCSAVMLSMIAVWRINHLAHRGLADQARNQPKS